MAYLFSLYHVVHFLTNFVCFAFIVLAISKFSLIFAQYFVVFFCFLKWIVQIYYFSSQNYIVLKIELTVWRRRRREMVNELLTLSDSCSCKTESSVDKAVGP